MIVNTETASHPTDIATQRPFEHELASLIVAALHLEISPTEIEPVAPLFGDGLGLDSIDALELALAISREFGLELKSDDDRNRAIFSNLRALADHVETHRAK
jgi:acyl carrier protein